MDGTDVIRKVCLPFIHFKPDHRLSQSTVLLNANIAFLAIGSIDALSSQSIVKLPVYLSTVASFGSVVMGLLLLDHSASVTRKLKDANHVVGDS
jgi:hypothetical protein